MDAGGSSKVSTDVLELLAVKAAGALRRLVCSGRAMHCTGQDLRQHAGCPRCALQLCMPLLPFPAACIAQFLYLFQVSNQLQTNDMMEDGSSLLH